MAMEFSNFPVRGTIFTIGIEEDVAGMFIKSAYKTSPGIMVTQLPTLLRADEHCSKLNF